MRNLPRRLPRLLAVTLAALILMAGGCGKKSTQPSTDSVTPSVTEHEFGYVPLDTVSELQVTLLSSSETDITGTVHSNSEYFVVRDSVVTVRKRYPFAFTVAFHPGDLIEYSATIQVPGYSGGIKLHGRGNYPNHLGTLTVSADSMDFGDVSVPSYLDRKFVIHNPTLLPLLAGAHTACADFYVVGHDTVRLPPGSADTMRVRFKPSLAGVQRCELQVNGLGSPRVQLRGTGRPTANCDLLPQGDLSGFYGNVSVGQLAEQEFLLVNEGQGAVTDSIVSNNTAFRAEPATFTVAPAQSVHLKVIFEPPYEGDFSATLTTHVSGCVHEEVRGTGTAAAPPGWFQFGSYGSGAGQFNGMGGVATDASGHVYVADVGNKRVQKFTAAGDFVYSFGEYGSFPGQFLRPRDIACDSLGFVYVTDPGNSRVAVFDSTGAYVSQFGSHGTANGQFLDVGGIGIGPGRTIWVTDLERAVVQAFDADGTYKRSIGVSCDQNCGAGQLREPVDVAPDANGTVYVLESDCAAMRANVQVYSYYGVFLQQWGMYGADPGKIGNGAALIWQEPGKLYVLDGECSLGSGSQLPSAINDRVTLYSTGGIASYTWGGKGSYPGLYSRPTGMALDKLGFAYIADSGNNRVQVLRMSAAPRLGGRAPAMLMR